MARDDLRRLRDMFRNRQSLRRRLMWTLVLGRRRGAHSPRPATPGKGVHR